VKKKKRDKLPNFSGKCLSITIRDDSVSHDLFDPHFEQQGNILFIVGTIPKGASDSDWSAKKVGAVAWDRVTDYFVFDGLEDYEKAIKRSKEYRSKKKKKKK